MSDILFWGTPLDPQCNGERWRAEIDDMQRGTRPPRRDDRAELEGEVLAELEIPLADCPSCRYYRPTTVNGSEIPCPLYVQAPEDCRDFRPSPPVELCRTCAHARWEYADRPPFCRENHPAEKGTCAGFEVRRPAEAIPCPTCGEPLEVRDGEAACPGGHQWKLRRSNGGICPRCGQRYATFGVDEGRQRVVYRVCTDPECRWNDRVYRRRRDAPPVGQRGHGGQRCSPVTGRVLAKRK